MAMSVNFELNGSPENFPRAVGLTPRDAICADKETPLRSNPLKSWPRLMSILVIRNCLAFESPHIERHYLWRITIDIDSYSVIRPLREDQVSNSHEAIIAEQLNG